MSFSLSANYYMYSTLQTTNKINTLRHEHSKIHRRLFERYTISLQLRSNKRKLYKSSKIISELFCYIKKKTMENWKTFNTMENKLEAESNNANTVLGAGFYLDCADDGRWLIKQGDKRYTAGYDKQKVLDLISRLNEAHRPNVEQSGENEIFVCWNNHDKGQKCEWVCEIKTCT